MDRRNFLKGTFGGVTAGGIILAAGVPDTQEFIEKVKVGDPVAAVVAPPIDNQYDWMVYDRTGNVIGHIVDARVEYQPMSVTRVRDGNDVYMPGLMEGTLTVKVFNTQRMGAILHG